MMHLQTTFELSMVLDSEKFDQVLAMTDYFMEKDETYIDQSLASKGVMITYRNSQYKKIVKLFINTALVFNTDEPNPNKVIHKLEKYIHEYFHYSYELDDFDCKGMILSTDIHVNHQDTVHSYLKVLKRVGKVKGFSPTKFEFLTDVPSFCLEGNSNGINFLLYDLEELLVNRLSAVHTNKRKQNTMTTSANGILRTEVRLSKPKAIHSYTNATVVSKQMAELLEKSNDIFMDTFVQVVPFGDFHKKEKAVEIIRKEVKNLTLRRRMLQLVTLIPEKKSLLLAQKALNHRCIAEVMEGFAAIQLSPVTLSKRHDVKYLKNLYAYVYD